MENASVNKTDKHPPLLELTSYWGRDTINKSLSTTEMCKRNTCRHVRRKSKTARRPRKAWGVRGHMKIKTGWLWKVYLKEDI